MIQNHGLLTVQSNNQELGLKRVFGMSADMREVLKAIATL
jgi:hypothetical protein